MKGQGEALGTPRFAPPGTGQAVTYQRQGVDHALEQTAPIFGDEQPTAPSQPALPVEGPVPAALSQVPSDKITETVILVGSPITFFELALVIREISQGKLEFPQAALANIKEDLAVPGTKPRDDDFLASIVDDEEGNGLQEETFRTGDGNNEEVHQKVNEQPNLLMQKQADEIAGKDDAFGNSAIIAALAKEHSDGTGSFPSVTLTTGGTKQVLNLGDETTETQLAELVPPTASRRNLIFKILGVGALVLGLGITAYFGGYSGSRNGDRAAQKARSEDNPPNPNRPDTQPTPIPQPKGVASGEDPMEIPQNPAEATTAIQPQQEKYFADKDIFVTQDAREIVEKIKAESEQWRDPSEEPVPTTRIRGEIEEFNLVINALGTFQYKKAATPYGLPTYAFKPEKNGIRTLWDRDAWMQKDYKKTEVSEDVALITEVGDLEDKLEILVNSLLKKIAYERAVNNRGLNPKISKMPTEDEKALLIAAQDCRARAEALVRVTNRGTGDDF